MQASKASWTQSRVIVSRKPAVFEHPQHRHVIRKNLCSQFRESCSPCNHGEMAQQRRTQALPLIRSVLDSVYGAVLAVALWVTIDLDYPGIGVIMVSNLPVAAALAAMN
jgi:hypothetical protein